MDAPGTYSASRRTRTAHAGNRGGWLCGCRWRAGRNGGCGGAPGRHMRQEAPHKLILGQRHGLEAARAFYAVVFVSKGDAVRVGADPGSSDAAATTPATAPT